MNEEVDLINDLLAVPTETEELEFKRLSWDWGGEIKRIMQSIVAFTNTEGWRIVLWIDDPEKTNKKWLDRVHGIEENLENYDEIKREIQKIIPPFTLYNFIEIKAANNKTVVVIQIEKSQNAFHCWNKEVWVRWKKGNRQLTPQEIIHLSYAKGFEKSDEELINIDLELLDTEYFQNWRRQRDISGRTLSEILFRVGLARKNDSGTLLPTRASVLLFAEYPNDILDTKCTVRIFKYSWNIETFSETPNLLWTPKTINWPIIEQIKKAHEYVLDTIEKWLSIASGFTVRYKIPPRAVKEAITNAIIHRDYHMQRDIEIRIFEDRIEINSPWLFPSNITKANIGKVRSLWYRNWILVKHLREFPDPPNLDQNEWVKAMRSEMEKESLYPPIFMTYPFIVDSVRVILFNDLIATEWEKVQSYLISNKFITNEEARKITHIGDKDRMSKFLKQWTEKWLLIQIVPESWYKRWTKYKLA